MNKQNSFAVVLAVCVTVVVGALTWVYTRQPEPAQPTVILVKEQPIGKTPEEDTRLRWLVTSYDQTIYHVQGKQWMQVNNETHHDPGKIMNLTETARTSEYVEIIGFNFGTGRVFADRLEMKRGDKWEWVSNGHWLPSGSTDMVRQSQPKKAIVIPTDIAVPKEEDTSWSVSVQQSDNIFGRDDDLKLIIGVNLPDREPVKRLTGHVTLYDGEMAVFTAEYISDDDKSFAGYNCRIFTIGYDDNNPAHRSLKFKTSEFRDNGKIKGVFKPSEIIYADGRIKRF